MCRLAPLSNGAGLTESLVSPLFREEEYRKVVLSRTVVVFLVVMALGIIGLLGAVSAASPKGNDDDHNDSEGRSSLTVSTKTVEEKVVDLGAQGLSQGDMRVVNAPLYNESGKQRIGRLDLLCVVTDPADEPSEKAHRAQCTITYTLAGGEISAQGVDAFPELPGLPSKSVDAISGGTEDYAGLQGEVRFETRSNKVISTFHFTD